MLKKYVVVLMICLFLWSCAFQEEDPSSSTPATQAQPASSTPAATFTPTASPAPSQTFTPSPTLYAPRLKETPLPPVVDAISEENAANTSLLARWEAAYIVPNSPLSFSEDSSTVQIGPAEWRMADGARLGLVENTAGSDQYAHRGKITRSPDGRFIATIDNSLDLKIKTSEASPSLHYYFGNAVDIAFLPDNQHLAIVLNDGNILFVAIATWEQRLLDLEEGHTYYDDYLEAALVLDTGSKPPQRIYFSPDNALMVVQVLRTEVQVWRLSDLAILFTTEGAVRPNTFALDATGDLIATAFEDGMIVIWLAESGEMLGVLEGHEGGVRGLGFSPDNRYLVSYDENDWIHVWGMLPKQEDQDAAGTATVIAGQPAAATKTPVVLPGPTGTPASSLPPAEMLPWPLAPAVALQVEEAKACEVESLAKERYPASLSYWEMETAFHLETACDWAVLAMAYKNRVPEDTVPEEGKRAFYRAISINSAMAYLSPLFYIYFGSFDIVEPFTDGKLPIVQASIDYMWSGIGEPSQISYHVDLTQAHLETANVVLAANSTNIDGGTVARTVDGALVQELLGSLENFVPAGAFIPLTVCTDNYSDWNIELRFQDGSELNLKTAGSNMLTRGGPWQVEIGGQVYIQYAPSFLISLNELIEALGLPIGQPYAMHCSPIGVLNDAFP